MKKLLDRENKGFVLLKNTVMLYILQFSSYLFSFITVPYQTRVLGPEIYGLLGVAGAIMMYFQLFMDFGFLLSATEDVSKNRDDHSYICKKITSIAIIKLCFAIISFLVMAILCFTVSKISKNRSLYFIYLAAFVINSFLPDYIYRGIEKMTAITVRTVCIKFFFCVMIFAFLKTEKDYLIVPVLLLIGNAAAVVGAYIHLFKTMKYGFKSVTFKEIVSDFKRSSVFFYSRIATTVYTATNTVVLGMIDKAGTVTGYFTSADKIVTTAKNGLSPVSDSLYPYMVKNRDFRLVKKLLIIFMPAIITGCAVVAIFSKPLCIIAFGKEYGGTAPILCAFLPVIVATLPNYIFGFPVLGAMGISKYANYSIFVGSAIHLFGLIILYLTGSLTGVSLAALTSVSEWSILTYRVAVVIKNRKLITGENK